jgi:hypothetical protein
MRSLPFILGIFSASLLGSGAQVAVDEAKIAELQAAISKLVDVQTLESKERLDWQAKQASLQNLLELHQRELNLLNEELAKAGKTAPAHEEQTAEMEAEIEALKQARRLIAEAVVRNKPRLIQLTQIFPKPLLIETQSELAALKTWTKDEEAREGLMAMLGVIDKAEQFNRRFTRAVEVRDGSEVQVLYLGLAQAYYIDRGDKAGIGRPAAKGWKWESKPEIRGELAAAFDIMDKKRPPATVSLPLKLD